MTGPKGSWSPEDGWPAMQGHDHKELMVDKRWQKGPECNNHLELRHESAAWSWKWEDNQQDHQVDFGLEVIKKAVEFSIELQGVSDGLCRGVSPLLNEKRDSKAQLLEKKKWQYTLGYLGQAALRGHKCKSAQSKNCKITTGPQTSEEWCFLCNECQQLAAQQWNMPYHH